MQALARAGVVESVRGAGGGYRLAKAPEKLTLWDIVVAIEGEEPPFRCTEIRQQGPCPGTDFRKPCEITAVFRKAEAAWRAELKSVSLADIVLEVARKQTPAHRAKLSEWLQDKMA
jgi:Rrf2 family protein